MEAVEMFKKYRKWIIAGVAVLALGFAIAGLCGWERGGKIANTLDKHGGKMVNIVAPAENAPE
jgi:hypothetical protein